jgi:signal transduction histidine kinase
MAALTEELYSAGHKLFDLQVERLIVLLRVTLAAFSAVAFLVDPEHGTTNASAIVAILVGYTAFGVIVAVISFIARARTGWQLPVHLVDTGMIALLMYFLDPISNRSFLLYTLLLLGATVRWNWRGALWTAVSLLGLELVLGMGLAGGTFATKFLLDTPIQGAFLLVVGGMFAFFGATREGSQRRLIELAAWPETFANQNLHPPTIQLEKPLAHIASVLQVPRVLMLWTLLDEPFMDAALWASGDYQHQRRATSELGDWTASELRESTFASPEVGSGNLFTFGPLINYTGPLLNLSLETEFQIRSVASAPVASAHCTGRIFMLDKQNWTEDDLTLTEMVASRMAVELEQFVLRIQLADAAAVMARNRLARDLHDGILQGLTAAGLQLQALAVHADEPTKSTIGHIRQLLFQEQKRIRMFLEDKQTLVDQVPLQNQLKELLEQNARRWGCDVPFILTPDNSVMRSELIQQLDFILTESIANAVRHGHASRVDVTVHRSSDHVQLLIKDNGHGLDRTGVYTAAELEADNWGPVSLRSRIAELKGSLVLSSSPKGVELRIELPG